MILDVELRSVDGRTLYKAMKEMEAHWYILIIICSAKVYYEKNATEYLCDDFIEKRLEMTSLIGMLNSLIVRQGDVISKIIP